MSSHLALKDLAHPLAGAQWALMPQIMSPTSEQTPPSRAGACPPWKEVTPFQLSPLGRDLRTGNGGNSFTLSLNLVSGLGCALLPNLITVINAMLWERTVESASRRLGSIEGGTGIFGGCFFPL